MAAASTTSKSLHIVAVEVAQTGIASPPQPGYPADYCNPFRPDARRVLAWFKAAHRVPVAATVEADRSACLARGTLRTLDGRRYEWELDQAGLAAVFNPQDNNVYYMGHELPFKP